MNKNRLLGIGLIFLIVAFVFVQPAYVGPGAKTAKAVITTFWGSILFGLVAMTCLSMSIYAFLWGKIEGRRPLKDLF